MTQQSLRLLAFDTSCEVTSVAVCAGGQVLARDEAKTEARHAEVLLPKLRGCLSMAGLSLADIDAIGVGVGPGSFTGVRVGVATAKGLGLALQKPVLPVVSLEALALDAREHTSRAWIVACLDAFKGELFAAVYRRTVEGITLAHAPFHAPPEQVYARVAAVSGFDDQAFVGSGVYRYPALRASLPDSVQCLDAALAAPSAGAIATLAAAAFARGEIPALASIAPLYLRDSDAQLPKVPLRV
ncbi:MAG: tRNA (adenosine(37)-N6)-threonylcarbamoyltransferase complex dimerization subunit type 1 TsaB [Polyangiales bacterium]